MAGWSVYLRNRDRKGGGGGGGERGGGALGTGKEVGGEEEGGAALRHSNPLLIDCRQATMALSLQDRTATRRRSWRLPPFVAGSISKIISFPMTSRAAVPHLTITV